MSSFAITYERAVQIDPLGVKHLIKVGRPGRYTTPDLWSWCYIYSGYGKDGRSAPPSLAETMTPLIEDVELEKAEVERLVELQLKGVAAWIAILKKNGTPAQQQYEVFNLAPAAEHIRKTTRLFRSMRDYDEIRAHASSPAAALAAHRAALKKNGPDLRLNELRKELLDKQI